MQRVAAHHDPHQHRDFVALVLHPMRQFAVELEAVAFLDERLGIVDADAASARPAFRRASGVRRRSGPAAGT